MCLIGCTERCFIDIYVYYTVFVDLWYYEYSITEQKLNKVAGHFVEADLFPAYCYAVARAVACSAIDSLYRSATTSDKDDGSRHHYSALQDSKATRSIFYLS